MNNFKSVTVKIDYLKMTQKEKAAIFDAISAKYALGQDIGDQYDLNFLIRTIVGQMRIKINKAKDLGK